MKTVVFGTQKMAMKRSNVEEKLKKLEELISMRQKELSAKQIQEKDMDRDTKIRQQKANKRKMLRRLNRLKQLEQLATSPKK